jgi:hypothetical protein
MQIWKIAGGGASGQAGQLRRAGRALELLELQLEGKKRIGGEAFANGQRLQENESLGG